MKNFQKILSTPEYRHYPFNLLESDLKKVVYETATLKHVTESCTTQGGKV